MDSPPVPSPAVKSARGGTPQKRGGAVVRPRPRCMGACAGCRPQPHAAPARTSSLGHELGDDAVEGAALEVQRLARLPQAPLARAQRPASDGDATRGRCHEATPRMLQQPGGGWVQGGRARARPRMAPPPQAWRACRGACRGPQSCRAGMHRAARRPGCRMHGPTPEVLAGPGAHVSAQLHDHLARVLAVDADVPEHARVLHGGRHGGADWLCTAHAPHSNGSEARHVRAPARELRRARAGPLG